MRIAGAAFLLVMTLVFVRSGYAQDSEDLKTMREEIKALKAGQAAIQKELETIKSLLSARQPQPPAPFKEATLPIDSGYVKGDKRAKLVLVEFSEYQ
jgi:protein-disulfide isomerase